MKSRYEIYRTKDYNYIIKKIYDFKIIKFSYFIRNYQAANKTIKMWASILHYSLLLTLLSFFINIFIGIIMVVIQLIILVVLIAERSDLYEKYKAFSYDEAKTYIIQPKEKTNLELIAIVKNNKIITGKKLERIRKFKKLI